MKVRIDWMKAARILTLPKKERDAELAEIAEREAQRGIRKLLRGKGKKR